MSVPSATGTPAACSVFRLAYSAGRLAPDVLERGVAAAVPVGVFGRPVARERLPGEPAGSGHGRVGEDGVDERPRVREELEDVHRRDVEDRPGLHGRDRLRVERLEHTVRERRRAAGDRLLRVGELRRVHRGAKPLARRLVEERGGDVRAHPGKRRRAAPRHVVEHQLDLGRAERLRLRDGRARRLRSRGKPVEVRVRGLPLRPPSAADREDRRGREDVRNVGAGARVRREPHGLRHVLRHQPHGRDAPPQHRLQVRVRLGVDVRVDQARDDPASGDVHLPGAGRQRRERLGGRRPGGDDAPVA